MSSYSTTFVLISSLYISSFVIVNLRAGATVEEEFKGKQPYIFPKIKDGNAVEAASNLLRSQRTYQREVDKLFREMCRKNKNHTEIDLFERSIDGTIAYADELITNSTTIIDAHIKNGSTDAYFRRKPITYKAARELMECWKYVDDFVNNYLTQFDFDVKKESAVMQKPVDNGIRELEEYNKYLDIVYNETGVYRDETGFRYLKYGKVHEKKNN